MVIKKCNYSKEIISLNIVIIFIKIIILIIQD